MATKEAEKTVEKPPVVAVIGPVRFSYMHVFKPRLNTIGDDDRMQYEVTILIPKKGNDFCKDPKAEVDKLVAIIKSAAVERFKDIPKVWKNPFKDGDKEFNKNDEPKHPGYWFASCAEKEDYPPKLIGGTKNADGEFEEVTRGWVSGDWGKVKIRAYAFDHPKGGKGVGLGLQAVQFLYHDEPFGVGGNPTDGFEEVADAQPGLTGSQKPEDDPESEDYDPFEGSY